MRKATINVHRGRRVSEDSLAARLAQKPEFRQAVLRGVQLAALCNQFANWGRRSTVKDARRIVWAEQGKPEPEVISPADSSPEVGEDREETKNRLCVTLARTPMLTLEEFVQRAKVDLEVWEVVKFRHKSWDGYAKVKNESGAEAINVVPLYSISAEFARKQGLKTLETDLEAILARFAERAPKRGPLVYTRDSRPEHLFEPNIPDLHVGKYCWSDETGEDNYDVELARRTFFTCIEELIARAAPFRVGRVVFPVGSDLLHVDNPSNTTTGGTPQDADGRYARTYRTVIEMLIEGIDRLAALAPVDVIPVPGNHDRFSTFTMGEALRAYYSRDPNVEIRNDPKLRKYYEYGRNMIVFTHGSEEKPLGRLGEIAAAEEPEMWGRTLFREAHTGHLHKLAVEERSGFRVRIVPSLCPPDAWHAKCGYTRNVRSAEAFVWTPDNGIAAQIIYNVPRGL